MCFGANGDSYGWFTAPINGSLVAVKLVHRFGYVSCHVHDGTNWSFWGCGEYKYKGPNRLIDTVTTDDHNRTYATNAAREEPRWLKMVQLRSLDITRSPLRFVRSRFSPTSVYRGKRLRLWYGEDLANLSEGDNGGKVCCKVYAMYTEGTSLHFED